MFPACRSSHSLCLPANEKDVSLSLEMTNAGKRHFRIESHLHVELVKCHSPSFPWKEVPRRGGGWHRSGIKIVRGAVFSYRHPERSRGIFFVCRVPFPVWNGLHETPFFGGRWEYGASRLPFLSHPFLTANEKDFSLSLEMTNACEAAFSYRHPERSRGIFFVCHFLFHA